MISSASGEGADLVTMLDTGSSSLLLAVAEDVVVGAVVGAAAGAAAAGFAAGVAVVAAAAAGLATAGAAADGVAGADCAACGLRMSGGSSRKVYSRTRRVPP